MDIKRSLKLLFPNFYVWRCTRQIRRNAKMLEEEIKSEISRLYRYYVGRDLDWSNLKRYTEKMQWKKIYSIGPLEKMASDKFAVRKWVEEKIGPEYLIPLLGVWDRFEDIDFDELPEKFVLKTTHGSASIVIVKDRNTFDRKYAKLLFKVWMSFDYAYASFEMNYKDIPRRIIAEKYMEDPSGELRDYKFRCFDGKPYCCWIDKGRFSNHTRDIFDMDWNLMPFIEHFPNSGEETPKPKNFDKMIEIATKLSEGFPHVRVDLYNIDGKIYFGELTFCESSGYCKITPDEYDFEMGEMWHLPIDDKIKTSNN